jgi:DNA-binding MarR family transcriptional regulator
MLGSLMTVPNRATQTAWTTLISTSRRLLEAVEGALKSGDHPPLAWYDALLEIERADPDGLRPFELKDRLLLPQYGTSRLLDRLIKANLVSREACGDDGRGQILHITEQGRSVRKAMWPVYAEVLSHEVGARLTAEEAIELARLLSKLRAPDTGDRALRSERKAPLS